MPLALERWRPERRTRPFCLHVALPVCRFFEVVSWSALAAADGQAVRRPGNVVAIPFSFWMEKIAHPERRLCRSRGVPKPVVPAWYEGPLCGLPVVPAWYEGPWCGLPVM